jgi:hypothetical protein
LTWNRDIPKNNNMKSILLIIALLLTGCGTLGGLANGAGEVLEGAAYDARSVGSLLVP